jgi:hypothetical protein
LIYKHFTYKIPQLSDLKTVPGLIYLSACAKLFLCKPKN